MLSISPMLAWCSVTYLYCRLLVQVATAAPGIDMLAYIIRHRLTRHFATTSSRSSSDVRRWRTFQRTNMTNIGLITQDAHDGFVQWSPECRWTPTRHTLRHFATLVNNLWVIKYAYLCSVQWLSLVTDNTMECTRENDRERERSRQANWCALYEILWCDCCAHGLDITEFIVTADKTVPNWGKPT